jgi:hypothetical protein
LPVFPETDTTKETIATGRASIFSHVISHFFTAIFFGIVRARSASLGCGNSRHYPRRRFYVKRFLREKAAQRRIVFQDS